MSNEIPNETPPLTTDVTPEILTLSGAAPATEDPGPGKLLFHVGGQEQLRLEPNGEIFVRGVLATTDLEVVDGMRDLVNRHFESLGTPPDRDRKVEALVADLRAHSGSPRYDQELTVFMTHLLALFPQAPAARG